MGLQWGRCSQVFQNPNVFSGGIEPNDIQQGGLGNCYFLAVLSAMAEFPDRIKSLFYTRDRNDAGCYLVCMFINGKPMPIILDDWIPTRFGQAAFSKSKQDELWAILLEKAWAKIQGTYARTEGGMCATAAAHLLGVPTAVHQHEDIMKEGG